MSDSKVRCAWVNLKNPLYVDYHDNEWGVPVHDDRSLFELLTLEGAQAGLSWESVLNKRAGYRDAFDNFDIEAVSRYPASKLDKLMANPAIIRNRLKLESVVSNARAVMAVQEEVGSFDEYLWSFVDGWPLVNLPRSPADVPATTALSDLVSRELKRRGFKFVGSTIAYAFLQAAGLVDDHTTDCHKASLAS
jgi:DNA-3-methyladenine glycosylase I